MVRTVPLPMIVVLLAAAVAHGADPGVVGYGDAFVSKPRRLDSSKTIAPGQYDETQIKARRLRWRSWGTKRTVARGRVTHCVIEYLPCKTARGRVVLRGEKIGCGDFEPVMTYTRVRYFHPRGKTPWLDIIPC